MRFFAFSTLFVRYAKLPKCYDCRGRLRSGLAPATLVRGNEEQVGTSGRRRELQAGGSCPWRRRASISGIRRFAAPDQRR